MRAVSWVAVVVAGCGSAAAPRDGGPVDAEAPADGGATDAAADAPPGPATFTGVVRGRVTAAGAPVEGAIVRFAGRVEEAVSGTDGRFTLTVVDPPVVLRELALAAGKAGYWNRGIRVVDPTAAQEIAIDRIDRVDDPAYEFKSPDARPNTPHCVHCHPAQTEEWRGSAHAASATNPRLADLYNGTAHGVADEATCVARGGAWRQGRAPGGDAPTQKCYVGAGLLAELNPGRCGGAGQPTCDDPTAPAEARPVETSLCAGCHAPVLAAAGVTDLNRARGVALDGVSCDLCHKIREVVVNERPGVLGAAVLLRPGPPGRGGGFSDPEIMFGPYPDAVAFFMGSTYQPQFRRAELCSACHQWSEAGFRAQDRPLVDRAKWPDGLPIQDTYDEWRTSPWATAGVQCQHCHMPASMATNPVIDHHELPPSTSGVIGFDRPYGEIRRHLFAARLADEPGRPPAPGEPPRALLRQPLELTVTATRTGGTVTATVRLHNAGAGHSIPSGSPSRALLLLVTADAGGAPLAAIGGQTVPEWTGARAAATVGVDATVDGRSLTRTGGWPADVVPGAVVRVVRATGAFADDPGRRWFGDPARTPAEKGLAIAAPVAETTVTAIAGERMVLADAIAPAPGDRVLIGDPIAGGAGADDASPQRAIAGAAGWAFGKVMRAADGTRAVPFFEAVDLAADNRIPADASATTTHVFAASPGPMPVRLTVTVLFRRDAWSQARLRGWDAVDVVRAVETTVVEP